MDTLVRVLVGGFELLGADAGFGGQGGHHRPGPERLGGERWRSRLAPRVQGWRPTSCHPRPGHGRPSYRAANVPQVVVTVAAKATVPFGWMVPLPGTTATPSTLSAPTVMVACAVFVGSAWLTTVTW